MRATLSVFLLVTILGLSFAGTRGIWEPDEGYYIGIARNMVETGDWIVPQLNLRPFLDKPPIVYWGAAFLMERFGFNEWAARSPHAIWFILTGGVVYLLGCELFDKRTALLACIVYATSPIPFIASNIVTPDTPLAFCIGAMNLCFWKVYRLEASIRRLGWEILLGVSTGLAFLSKGPATFVFMAPVFCFLLTRRELRSYCLRPGFAISVLLFFLIGGSWYAAVIYYIPGASAYFFDNQVTGRLFTEKYNRNSDWYAFLYVYFPVILFGTLPWSAAWYPNAVRLLKNRVSVPKSLRAWHPKFLFLAFAVVVPLIVFCAASSRLPLYLLPLFIPMSLISAFCWQEWKPAWFSHPTPGTATPLLALWVVLLVVVKGGMAYWPTDRDTRAFWKSIENDLPEGRTELVVVNMRRRGLSFYTDRGVELVTTKSKPYPSFYETEKLSEEVHELSTSSHRHVFLVRDAEIDETVDMIRESGATFRVASAPGTVHIITVEPANSENRIVRIAALGDTRSGDSGQVQLGSALYHTDEEEPLNGIVLLGDNLSFLGEPRYFNEHFVKPYNALLEAGVPFYAVLGNHDIKGGFAGFQLNHPFLNMNGHRYYSETFGEDLVECFMIDTNTIVADPKQLTWLIDALSKSQARWKIVAMHDPLYGGIERRPEADPHLRERLEPIFLKGGVDIAVSGHNHVYQRRRPVNGIHYFTAGSGGKLDRGQNLEGDPDLMAGNDQTNVALILEFDRDECRFEAIDSLENVVDQGTISETAIAAKDMTLGRKEVGS